MYWLILNYIIIKSHRFECDLLQFNFNACWKLFKILYLVNVQLLSSQVTMYILKLQAIRDLLDIISTHAGNCLNIVVNVQLCTCIITSYRFELKETRDLLQFNFNAYGKLVKYCIEKNFVLVNIQLCIITS